jgi:general secretion pathway protein A
MYEKHFGFREEPFGVAPDPRFLYCSPQHAEALAALHYGLVEHRGILVLTAAAGMGKTTLLYRLLEQWRDRAAVAFLFRPPESRDELLGAVLEDLGLSAGGTYSEKWRQLQNQALECRRRGRRLLLFVDEAQTLGALLLEEIRLLSNLESPEEKLLDVVLAGQPSLLEQLLQPESSEFRQRVGVWARIAALDAAEVRRYVQHRLKVAGRLRGRILQRRALAALDELSGGVPRNINNLCFEALSQAFAEGHKHVEEVAVRRAAAALGPELGPPMAAPGRVATSPRMGWVAAAVAAGIAVGALAASLYFPREWRKPEWRFWNLTAVSAAPANTVSPAGLLRRAALWLRPSQEGSDSGTGRQP